MAPHGRPTSRSSRRASSVAVMQADLAGARIKATMTYDFQRREQELAASAADELPLLPLALNAVEFVAGLLNELPAVDLHDPPTGAECRKITVFQLAALSVRTCSAIVALIRIGYEPESHTLKRRSAECLDRVTAVVADTSGEAARQWLAGRGRTPRSTAQRHGSVKAFDFYSQSAHALGSGVAHLWNPPMSVPVDASIRSLVITPFRDRMRANALLFDAAYELGAIASGIAEVYSIAVLIPAEVASALKSGREWLEANRP